MKKLIIAFGLLLTITACSLNDDDGANFTIAFVPTDSVRLPDTLVIGQSYEFKLFYTRPNGCYQFRRVNYEQPNESNIARDSMRFSAIENNVFDDPNCTQTMISDSAFIRFDTRYEYDYIFNFYQGQDDNDEPIFLTDTIPVKRP